MGGPTDGESSSLKITISLVEGVVGNKPIPISASNFLANSKSNMCEVIYIFC